MTSIHDQTRAFGQPGIEPRWTRGNKDAVGTAYSASSRLWFTLSGGVVNEVHYPTIDRPQIRDLQYLVTDGESFFHDERRHLDSSTRELSHHALGYEITSVDREGRYRLLLAHEDKTYPGALIASLSIPWGESRGDDDIGGYHLVWTRAVRYPQTGRSLDRGFAASGRCAAQGRHAGRTLLAPIQPRWLRAARGRRPLRRLGYRTRLATVDRRARTLRIRGRPRRGALSPRAGGVRQFDGTVPSSIFTSASLPVRPRP